MRTAAGRSNSSCSSRTRKYSLISPTLASSRARFALRSRRVAIAAATRRGCDHRANRRQPAAHRFRDAQHVGVKVEVLACEQPTSPAESARDFIGDEQRAVTAAEVAYLADGIFLWNQDAEIDADRLHDECGDVAPLQPLLDVAQCLCVERRGNLAALWQQVLNLLAVVGRADAQAGKCVAVIAAFER